MFTDKDAAMTVMGAALPAHLARARADDRYPSRFEAEPRWSARLDPVLHPEAAEGPLDAAQRGQYANRGWLSFDQLLTSDELAEALDALQALRRDPAVRARDEAVIEPGSLELRSVFAVHRGDDALARLCRHPRLVAVARQLLGGDVYIHQSRVNYKGGFRGREFHWHSDFETWHVEDGLPAMRALSCSIALTPNTPHNGPLMLIPGSHRTFIACVGQTPAEHYRDSLRQQEVGVPDDDSLTRLVSEHGIDAPTGPAGSVTFFDCNVMHGSNSNITPSPRSNLFVVFNSVDNRPVAPFCGLPPRPNFIAERQDFTPCT